MLVQTPTTRGNSPRTPFRDFDLSATHPYQLPEDDYVYSDQPINIGAIPELNK